MLFGNPRISPNIPSPLPYPIDPTHTYTTHTYPATVEEECFKCEKYLKLKQLSKFPCYEDVMTFMLIKDGVGSSVFSIFLTENSYHFASILRLLKAIRWNFIFFNQSPEQLFYPIRK